MRIGAHPSDRKTKGRKRHSRSAVFQQPVVILFSYTSLLSLLLQRLVKVKIKADWYITARTVQSKPLKVNSAPGAANVQSKWRM